MCFTEGFPPVAVLYLVYVLRDAGVVYDKPVSSVLRRLFSRDVHCADAGRGDARGCGHRGAVDPDRGLRACVAGGRPGRGVGDAHGAAVAVDARPGGGVAVGHPGRNGGEERDRVFWADVF